MGCYTDPKQFARGSDGEILVVGADTILAFQPMSGDATIINTGAVTVVSASETVAGKIEIATQTETNTGTDDTRAVTPLKLASTTVGGIDSDAVHDNGAGEITAVTAKTVPVSADVFLIEDSAAADVKKSLTFGNLEGTLSHDALADFVTNEHIDHSGVSITAGAGLTGGGDITTTRTLDTEHLDNPKAASYTAVAGDRATVLNFSGAGGYTLDLTAAATLGDGWYVIVANQTAGNVTVDPNAAETIDGAATLVIAAGGSVIIYCDGSNFVTIGTGEQLTSEQVQDIAGPLVATGGTKTGISITYQDTTDDMDFIVSDTTVAGDTGSTGITPGDTLTIAGGTGLTSVMSGDTLTVNGDAASETAVGVIEIATQAETDAGTDDTRAVTPLKLDALNVTGMSWYVDEDNMASNSASLLPSQQSVKTYVDNKVSGITWVNPVASMMLIGNLGEVALEALSPADGDCYVVSAVDGDGTLNPGAVTGLAVGDVVEFNTGVWVRIQAGVGGFVADGTRMALSTDTALIAPYTDTVDDGKIVSFDGTTLTGVDTSEAVDGNSFLIDGENGFYENTAWVFDGTVPTGTWVQFSGAGQINAGTGLVKSGNTLSTDLSELSTSGTFTPSADHVTGLDGGAQSNWLWTTIASAIFGTGFTVTSGVATPDYAEVGDLAGSNPGDAAAAGTSNELARGDHVHTRENIVFETVAAEAKTDDSALADTLDNTPLSGCPVLLFVNGQMIPETVGWTISGVTITWLGATGCFALAATDTIRVLYWY